MLRYLRKKEKVKFSQWLDNHLWLCIAVFNIVALAAIVVFRIFVLGR